MRDSIDFSNPDDKKLVVIFVVMAGLMLFCIAVWLLVSILPAKNGANLLLIREIGKITAIPRDKIYWICAQTGYKGGPFYVRLLIFTEKMLIDFDGNDIEHTMKVAEDIYQYILNVFEDYSTQHDITDLPSVLEKLYHEDRAGFMRLYEEEKQKLRS